MPDRVLIFAGLSLFLLLVTFPVWRGLASGSSAGPELAKPAGERCVAPKAFMRASHMELLREWREGKVRENRRTFTAADGSRYQVSLTATCLQRCHGSSKEFCDRCHSFAGIAAPNCWGCHTSPPSKQAADSAARRRS